MNKRLLWYGSGMTPSVTASAPKRMSREGRKQALLEAAARVLHDHSLAELSFELVAAEAGVSKTLPYTYFESPAEIAVLLFDAVVGRVDRETSQMMASVASFDDQLRSTLTLWCDAIDEDGRLVHALLDGRSVPAIRPLVDARDRAAVELWSGRVIEEFGLDPADAVFVGTMLTSAATATLRLWVRERQDRDEYLDRFVRATRALARGFGVRSRPVRSRDQRPSSRRSP